MQRNPDIKSALDRVACFVDGKEIKQRHSGRELKSMLEQHPELATLPFSYLNKHKNVKKTVYPIQYALRYCHAETIDLMLRHGAVLPETALIIAGSNFSAVEYLLKKREEEKTASWDDPVLIHQAIRDNGLFYRKYKDQLNHYFKNLKSEPSSYDIEDALKKLISFEYGQVIECKRSLFDLRLVLTKNPESVSEFMRVGAHNALLLIHPIEFALRFCDADVIDLLVRHGATLPEKALMLAGANITAVKYLLDTHEVQDNVFNDSPEFHLQAIESILLSDAPAAIKKSVIDLLKERRSIDWSQRVNGLTLQERVSVFTEDEHARDVFDRTIRQLEPSQAYEYGKFAPFIIAIKSVRRERDHSKPSHAFFSQPAGPNLLHEAGALSLSLNCHKLEVSLDVGLDGICKKFYIGFDHYKGTLKLKNPVWINDLSDKKLASYDSFIFFCYVDEFTQQPEWFIEKFKKMVDTSRLKEVKFIHLIDNGTEMMATKANRETVKETISKALAMAGCNARVVIDRAEFLLDYQPEDDVSQRNRPH